MWGFSLTEAKEHLAKGPQLLVQGPVAAAAAFAAAAAQAPGSEPETLLSGRRLWDGHSERPTAQRRCLLCDISK